VIAKPAPTKVQVKAAIETAFAKRILNMHATACEEYEDRVRAAESRLKRDVRALVEIAEIIHDNTACEGGWTFRDADTRYFLSFAKLRQVAERECGRAPTLNQLLATYAAGRTIK
jgi:hypothetical protein